MCTALAGTVGTGNIAGVCGAIAIGGPGAVFWMWVSALFGMATKFSEITLAVLVAIVYFGGVQRIGQVCELLVPGMALIFIVAGIGVVVLRADQIPAVFGAIFKGAFNPGAVAGGLVGTTMMTAVQKGVARGVFSNEAGLGTAPIAHAAADVEHPVQQGLYGIFEVFCDTIVICTLTALIVLCGNGVEGIEYGVAANQTLTTAGFCAVYPAKIATTAVAIALSLFAFSTILGWGVYGGRTAEYVFGEKAAVPYKIIYILFCAAGAVIDLKLVWDISDTLNGLMSIPNLTGVLLLSPVVVKLAKEYFAKHK
ncbi:MAG: alanine:cation symporter family protein [Oscillospiraceae bacterium]|nr:alanine:cation symporter family protein [Oscillospiraceae bacterium]